MVKFGINDKNTIFVDVVQIENKKFKILLDLILFLGSLGFLIVGISSFLNYNLLFFINASSVIFFPQGLVMSFYGFFGLIFALNQIFIMYSNLGEGYNFFNKLNGEMFIYRKRFPLAGTNIYLVYKIIDIVGNQNFASLIYFRFINIKNKIL
jgi:hypothetical protein